MLSGNEDHLRTLENLLSKHEIEFKRAKKGTIKGFDYAKGGVSTKNVDENSLVVSTDQSKGTLVKVLFEPNAKLSDSLTYDITAWSLPYAYGLNAIATAQTVPGAIENTSENDSDLSMDAYAYVTDWSSMQDARFLSHLLKNGIRVRAAYAPFSLNGKSYKRGSLIITKSDNAHVKNFIPKLAKASKTYKRALEKVSTGFVDTGKDFGSSFVQMVEMPKIAVLTGGPTSSYRFGEIWHFFEQQLQYPLTVIDADYADRVNFEEYDILVLPGGRYSRFMTQDWLKDLKAWVRGGGKLIAMGGAIKSIDGANGFGIKLKEQEKDTAIAAPSNHQDRQREAMKNAITGAIFKTKVDNTHPLAFGYGKTYFTLKLGNDAFDYLTNGNVVYLENGTRPISGFAGSDAQKKIGKSLVYGVENFGRGKVIYMVDNPLFRGFWENGKLFFANALFMVK